MSIKLYWWRGEGSSNASKQNFGDYLSPLIVEMVSGRKVEYAEPATADLIAIGSILSRERKAKGWLFRRKLHIWGAGTDSSSRQFSNRHYYHAVRGKRTLEAIKGCTASPALGDPGLLADSWWEGRPQPEKRFRVGLVPHFVDQGDPRVKELSNLPWVRMINVLDPVEVVVREIQSCEFIISSSMHGLIVADAFSIPNRRVVFSQGIISDYKFDDYYSAFGIATPEPVISQVLQSQGLGHDFFQDEYLRPGLNEVKARLFASFPEALR